MSVELKPCPLCGEQLEAWGVNYRHNIDSGCFLASVVRVTPTDVEAWNNRAASAAPAAGREAVDERAACVVREDCQWPACRRDCVIDSREHKARAALATAMTPTGTFACPICGRTSPHEHTAEEQIRHRNIKKKIPDWHEGTLMEILGKAGLRFQYRDENVRGALIAGIAWGFDQGIATAPTMSEAVRPEPGTTEYGSWINNAQKEANLRFSWVDQKFKWLCAFEQALRIGRAGAAKEVE
jgi:hypothetical protein